MDKQMKTKKVTREGAAHQTAEDVLGTIEVFRHVSAEARLQLARAGTLRRFHRREFILCPEADTVYIVFAGSVHLALSSTENERQVVLSRSQTQGYAPAQAGLVASSYGIGSIAAATAGGSMADRVGRKGTITTSMMGSAGAMLALSQARGLLLLGLLAGIAGLFSELYRPATGAFLADLVPSGQRVTAFATYRLAINMGFAAGLATAGFLADRSFVLLFLGDAATSIVFALVALFALPHTCTTAYGDGAVTGGVRPLLADRPFLLLLVAYVGVAFVYFQAQTTLSLHIRASGLSNAVYGSLLSLNGLLIVALELPLTSVTQRLPARPVIATGVFLVGAGFALTALAHSVVLLAMTVLVWTLGEMTHSPVAQAYVANLAPAALRGRYQGAFGLTWAIGLVAAPVLGTRLFAWNQTVLWIVCGVLGILGAILVLVAQPRGRGAES